MDPVDNTRQTPESAAYPSACKALAATNASVAIAGAGVIGATNPDGSNWRRFWASAGPGSWLSVISRAGHTKWLQGSRAECWCLDRAFSGGGAAREVVLAATAACMVAWFRQQLAEASMPHPQQQQRQQQQQQQGGREVNAESKALAQQPAARQVAVSAAATHGAAAVAPPPCAPGSPRGAPLPEALAPALGPLVEAAELVFSIKGGASATSHPLEA
ncbi:chlorophyllase I [Monoraphidium neglectum]|uniref:Chlorophyllase I n=1 Tax=Monoraphidium neglectum TaxID=145388 RepID=A0A0D2MDK7_9CHLO|nr:chlorophyllase I [Monoraphidium neglectum]KIY93305.1 chlorophyllase I [Monoraphidium neglectum]|eukprot:XP_013892325.1 chlorophyllase I [Monoraphidium neglectum]